MAQQESVETEDAKVKDRPFVNIVANRTLDSESSEGISDVEELEDYVFLGYFTIDSDGKKRPIPVPRSLVQMPAANEEGARSAMPGAAMSSGERTENKVEKSGKEVVLAEVRGIRISLSTDSQVRDL